VSPTLRVMWMLVRWPGLLLMLILGLQIAAAVASQQRKQFLLGIISLLGGGLWIAVRFKDFAASRAWRWLPGGQRVLTRALALLVLSGMSVVAALTCWAQLRGVVELPIRNVPLAFAAIAGVMFIAFAQRLPAIRPRVIHAFIVTLTLLFIEAIFREPALGLSWFTAISVVVLWLVAAFTGESGSQTSIAQWRDQLRARLPHSRTSRILQADGPLAASLPIAFIGTLSVAVLLHDALAIHARDSLSALLGGAAGFIAVAILFMAMAAARRARLLWLRCGDSRGEVLRLCERVLIVNLVVLTLVCWLAVTGIAVSFASWRMVPRAVAALPAMLAAALPALYLGLAWPTFASKWRDMPNGHIIFAAILLLPVVWRAAYAVVQPLELKPEPLLIAFTVVAALMLRALAVWRWRKIDWAYLKTETT
jgi:hypothetical protein